MTQVRDIVLSLIVGLFHLILAAIDAIERALRSALAQIGVHGQLQAVVLLIVAVLLGIAALQVFGRVFAVLIAIFLILLLLHGLAGPAGGYP